MTAEQPHDHGARPLSDGLTVDLHTIGELLEMGLEIPDYQRPYKWGVRNVADLIEDIDSFRRFGRYRLGTVILHDDDGTRNIVDGQQRFLTFCLIARALKDMGFDLPDISTQSVPGVGQEVSRRHLRENFQYIRESFIDRAHLQSWAEFFVHDCEVVVLTLSDVDEAFQMFDSQNTRGRALYPTDLLKAFQIREMSSKRVTEEKKLMMVDLWEDIPPESIHELFTDYLFKIRRWANGHSVPIDGFAAEHVGLFKGIRESDPTNAENRWAMPFLYAKNYTEDFSQENATLIRYGAMQAVSYPFQIDQPVINGETFFMMVHHYYELGLRLGLFRDDPASRSTQVLSEVIGTVERLNEHQRKSTHRLVRNLFDCLLLYYVDRFGDQELERATMLIVRYSMALRVQQKQVSRAMVNRYALGSAPSPGLTSTALFQELREALRARDFLQRTLPRPEFNGYEEFRPFFEDDEVTSA